MESTTKNRQPSAILRAMIARAYGASAVPDGDGFATELGHGWFNVAYRVTLRDGRRVVLKIAPPAGVAVLAYERGMMRNEIAAMRLLAEHATVPVPAVDYADTSGDLCGADWFTMPWVDGDLLDIVENDPAFDAPDLDRFREQLGALNRTMNLIEGPHFGPIAGPVPGRTTWREVFTGMIDDVLTDGERARIDLGHDYDELRCGHHGAFRRVGSVGGERPRPRRGDRRDNRPRACVLRRPAPRSGLLRNRPPRLRRPRPLPPRIRAEPAHRRRAPPAAALHAVRRPRHDDRDALPRAHRPGPVHLGPGAARRAHEPVPARPVGTCAPGGLTRRGRGRPGPGMRRGAVRRRSCGCPAG